MSDAVLVVGSGGREDALAWKLAQSPRVSKVYVAPGNGGTHRIGEPVPISVKDFDGLAAFAATYDIAMTVIGPDDPLARGIVDTFRAHGLRVFGPTRKAARLESSKAFAKRVMRDAGVATANYATFGDYEDALAHVRGRGAPVVVKADGLALGKGAYPCRTLDEAEHALHLIMRERVHEGAGELVIIEDFLEGEEMSLHAFSDGTNYSLMPCAQDHKRIGEGDTGKNTGGMGAIAPVPGVPWTNMLVAGGQVVEPVLDAMRGMEMPFAGVLYPGVMLTDEGIRVLEYNARFGDPETQVYMRLLDTDLLDVLDACVDGTLAKLPVRWRRGFAACVVLASGGYPDPAPTGFPITGIGDAEALPGVTVFHAGTRLVGGELRTSGGRVLGVTAYADTLEQALALANEGAERITFTDKYYRRDIGRRHLAHAPSLT